MLMKSFKSTKLFVLLTTLLVSISAYAVDFAVDGVSYNIIDSKGSIVAVVAGSTKYAGSVNIPATVTFQDKTYTVKQISSYAFDNCTELTSVTLGSNIEYFICVTGEYFEATLRVIIR